MTTGSGTFRPLKRLLADSPIGSRIRVATGAGRTLPLALLLVALVILAAGIGGTSDFTGPRWVPNLGGLPKGPLRKNPFTLNPRKARRPVIHHHTSSLPGWVGILVLAIMALILAAFVWRLWSARRMPAAPSLHGASVQQTTHVAVPEPEPEPEPKQLLTGIELALRSLDEQREPADAVVRAWLGLQETAEESGIVRYASETPTEFTTRILSSAFADDVALRTLLRLYLRTRFGDHPVTAADVADVREALALLLSNWYVAAGAPAPDGR